MKTNKIKALTFSMFIMLMVALVPNVFASAWVNDVDEADAEIIVSLLATDENGNEKTSFEPGEYVYVVLNIDQLPSNGRGLYAITYRFAYDSSKLELQKTTDDFGDECYYVIPGEVGTAFSLLTGCDATNVDCSATEGDNMYYVGFGVTGNYIRVTGTLCTIKFKVLDGFSGSIDAYIRSYSVEDDGCSFVGYDSSNNSEAKSTYIKTNLDALKSVVSTESISFDSSVASGISLSKTEAEAEQKALATYVIIDPTYSSYADDLTWKSSNTSVATVDDNGVVTAVGDGTATITVTTGDGKSASLTVTVSIPITGVSISVDSVSLDVTNNPTYALSSVVSVLPTGATAAGYTYESSDTNVATVSSSGVITAVGKGTATITVYVSGQTDIYDTVEVTVTSTLGSVSFSSSSVSLDTEENTTVDLSNYIVLTPTDADITGSYTYTSSNTSVATVSSSGVVTAVGAGTATITVSVDGKTATMTVKVVVPISSITLSETAVEVWKGEEVSVTVTASPDGSDWDTLSASPKSGGEYASAQVDGDKVVVTGISRGDAVFQVYANESASEGLVQELAVTVKENRITAASVTAEDDEDILRGNTKQLTSSYETEFDEETVHATTDDPTATWTSSDTSVATVDSNGLVTAVGEGTATITVEIAGYTATYDVTVTVSHVTGIVISDDEQAKLDEALTVGESVEIEFTVEPEDCTDTLEELLEILNLEYDEDLVDVEIT